jgi:hypothetical protein
LPVELMLLVVTKPKEARIHVDSLGGLQPDKLQQRIDPCGSWSHVVGFRPTGEPPPPPMHNSTRTHQIQTLLSIRCPRGVQVF